MYVCMHAYIYLMVYKDVFFIRCYRTSAEEFAATASVTNDTPHSTSSCTNCTELECGCNEVLLLFTFIRSSYIYKYHKINLLVHICIKLTVHFLQKILSVYECSPFKPIAYIHTYIYCSFIVIL